MLQHCKTICNAQKASKDTLAVMLRRVELNRNLKFKIIKKEKKNNNKKIKKDEY